MVGAKGFEPSTSWSRTRHLNPINALSGVAYGTRSVISPLLVVPNLYLLQWMRPGPDRRPPACKARNSTPTILLKSLTINLSNKSGNLLFAQKRPERNENLGFLHSGCTVEVTSEAWEALNKTLKAIDLAALSFPNDDLNWKLDGN